MEDTLRIAHEEVEKAQKRQKTYFDRKTVSRQFSMGDKVLVLFPTSSNKLLMQWKGPFVIEKVVGQNDYYVKVKEKSKIYHVNLLKRYYTREVLRKRKLQCCQEGRF